MAFTDDRGNQHSRPGMAKAISLMSPVTFSASGDNTVIAGVSGKVIRVYRILLVTTAATNLTMKDGASTNMTGVMSFGNNGSLVLDFDGEPWFTTASGNAFIINSSVATQISGKVWYSQE